MRTTATGEERADGRGIVRTMTGAAAIKAYRCPGCHRLIPAGVAHLVVWPSAPPIGGTETVTERRHWHTGCWTAGRTGSGR